MKNQIIDSVINNGSAYYEIGKYKTVKNSSSIFAAVKTGKVKISEKKYNEAGIGFDWVVLIPA